MRAAAIAIAMLVLSLSRVDGGTPLRPAEKLTDEAFAAAQRKDWETARTKFEQAYALEPRPLTLYNLAAAQENTNRLIAARDNYTKFLAAGDDPRFRQRAQEALKRLKTAIPTLTVGLQGATKGVSVAIDGVPAKVGAAVAVDPGRRMITVHRGDATVVTRSITLSPGEPAEVELVVPVPPLTRDDTNLERVEPSPPVSEPHPRSTLRSPWLWGVIAGVVVVGAGVTYWGVARPESDPTRGTLGTGVLPIP